MLPYVPGQPYHPINDKPTVINQLSNGFELLNGLVLQRKVVQDKFG
jgi:hypothetical protein